MQGTKQRMGPKRSPSHHLTVLGLSGRPLLLHPDGLLCQGPRWELRKRRVWSPLHVPQGRCREKGPERSAGSGRGRSTVLNHGGGKSPGLAQRPGRFTASSPALFPIPRNADRTGCSRERSPGRGGWSSRPLPASASLSRYRLPRGAWAPPALDAAFSRPGLSHRPLSHLPFVLFSSSLALFSPPSSPSQRCLPASASGRGPSTRLSLAFYPRE